MNAKRKTAQEAFLNMAKSVGSDNTHAAMTYLFDSLNDEEFDKLMIKIRDGKIILPFIVPHEEASEFDEHKVIGLIESLGGSLVQRLKTVSKDAGESMTDTKVLILHAYLKRAAQTLDKKISIGKGSKTSPLSGQVTRESKSSKVTVQEAQLLQGFGLDKVVEELYVPRGGDIGAARAMNQTLFTEGTVKLKDIEKLGTGVKSTRTIRSYLSASHIASTL